MNVWLSIAMMVGCTYLIRVLPLTLIRKPITNQFINSFLYYVPYATLSVMTVPAIIQATDNPLVGAAALVVGILAALFNIGLLPVTGCCCATVLILEFFI